MVNLLGLQLGVQHDKNQKLYGRFILMVQV